ncbi:MAG: hypothetical protein IMF19_05110 [Proteobacteria bacterium]|nr:hypothetical protein [Pseudomonadota bacterium]
MRKYSMIGQRVAQLKRLLRSDRIQVKRIVVAAHDNKADSVYVFFEYAEEESRKDKETLVQLKEKAVAVAENKVYQKLSNSKQRELYLLDMYALSKRDSGVVMELVKIIELEAKMEESDSEKRGEIKKEKNKKND